MFLQCFSHHIVALQIFSHQILVSNSFFRRQWLTDFGWYRRARCWLDADFSFNKFVERDSRSTNLLNENCSISVNGVQRSEISWTKLMLKSARKIQRWRGKYAAAPILYYPRPGDIFRNRNDFNLFGFRFVASSQAAYIYISLGERDFGMGAAPLRQWSGRRRLEVTCIWIRKWANHLYEFLSA